MDVKTACVIIPTYNEAGNLQNVLDLIYENIGKQNLIKVYTLIVDDNSPDGTGRLADEYSRRNKEVKVLHRAAKEGLGAAYIAGMQHALQELRPDVILEMDADLSHNPKDILRLIRAIEDGADVVIGSRYVEGGSIPEQWGFYRRLNSSTANALVRYVLGLGAKDCTGGFRAIRSSYLEHVDFTRLKTKGYAFQISLLNALTSLGADIREVPIHFSDRTVGTSKMRLKDQVDFIMTTFRIRAARDAAVMPMRNVTATPSAARRAKKRV
jgi:dolichol-phosphate mannosyltransferase